MWYSKGFGDGRWGYDAKPPHYEPERQQYMDGYNEGRAQRLAERDLLRRSYW